MSRLLLIARLALRDLRHRPVEAVLVLLAITAATATLTLGLVLRGVATAPSYEKTRAATAGPDVVATAVSGSELPGVLAQARKAGADAVGGPYPVASVIMRAGGYVAGVTAEGREQAPAAVDQPEVAQGNWVRPGGVVVERSFAAALGLSVGDRVTLNGRSFRVAGIAITAASPPYPETGFMPHSAGDNPGLVWLTRADATSLATSALPLTYTVDVRMGNPAAAETLAGPDGFTGNWTSWQAIAHQDAKEILNEQLVLDVGSWLLGLLAVASVAVLVGGRLAEQTRRVGLLKAAGAAPGLVTSVLLAEYVLLALAAAAAGLAAGRLAAPMLTDFTFFSGLQAAPAEPPVTIATLGLVAAVALAVAAASTLVPAYRASRASTVDALADAARPPGRLARLTALSARLPAPLLLGFRLAARRPRRSLLSVASVAIAVTAVVTVLIYHASHGQSQPPPGAPVVAGGPSANPVSQVMLVLTVALIVLAAINAIFTAWATVLDARYPAALARALGTTPSQLTAGLSASQLMSALPGALLGIPAGVALYTAVSNGAAVTLPSVVRLAAVVLGALVTVAVLTAVPARVGARQPVALTLRSEQS